MTTALASASASPSAAPWTRVRRAADFSDTLRRGVRARRPLLTVHALRGGEGIRVGFVTGRRVGGAVARNRARRLMREAWRATASELEGPWTLVIAAAPAAADATMSSVQSDLREALRGVGALS